MITLASDFPTPYPAAMRGVICSRSDARIEEIAHDFPRQDVRATAFWLREVLPYFPPATHCVVVDPGVGTDRAAVVVEAGDHHVVAPDNGVAIPVARELAGDDFAVWEIEYEDDETASNTFHGRDVFAPGAADVHDAGGPEAVDRCVPTDDWVDLTFPEPEVLASAARGEVLVVDGFGNVVTNVPGETVADRDTVRVGGESVPVRDAYAALDPEDRLVTVGSHGNVEFAVNQGRGDEAFGLAVGDDVLLEW
ncbi:SAM hydrolase/SAM-dependent halogenase family protein [Halosimplex salinum]|uniref:SAM hydrolase/SAM-dependent halogenase family protein n=1 Tax=Halosimplex salinum TaxID=1710538 RepID=UPI000F4A99DD|nr:SAM-dependent chlorinase/fluorinase [Halosimplex salinum]